jgi:hypothetical protein
MEIPTVVVFRKFKDNGEIIAVFPQVPGSTRNWYYCETYVRCGQHGCMDISDIIRLTKVATPEEYIHLQNELEGAPFHYLLYLRNRISKKDNEIRRATWLTLRKRSVR